ncbi:glycoside hydrolase [Xylaria sp. FL1042]|nr:glycoside hydrolase [Xylaria sp. FL1042]
MKGLFTKAVPLLLALGTQAATCQRDTDKPKTDTKRVVQYYGSQTNDDGAKFHIDLLVNNTDNKTYATNVLMGEFDLKANTMGLNGGDPDALANDWFWDEIKTVQDAGVKVSLWLRQGYEFLKKNNNTFDTHYALVNKTITDHGFDGIDLDIEDGENGCSDGSMNLADTIHLVKRLRADFGPDFIITLAPVSNALLDEGSVSCFSYKDLEKQAASDINWYNAQFYGNSWKGLKTPDYYERCVNEGSWKPERIVTTVYTSSDFTYPYPRSSWVGLNETGPTIETLVEKYADFGGVGGFDYYDAEPGGYPHPWQWSRWAARRMGA